MESTLLHSISPEHLNAQFASLNAKIEHLEKNLQSAPIEELLTRDETAQFLKVDKSTLWHWGKSGKLTPVGLGGKVWYKKSDILAALRPIN